VKKTYLAITHGTPPEGLVDLPLELDPENPLRVKMRVAARGCGLDARTGLSVLAERGAYALVSCALHTGRQHQIRVHLATLGTPIVGDKLYGPDERLLARAADGELDEADLARLELPRHALHAHRYALSHPLLGSTLEVSSPLPKDLADFWDTRGPENPGKGLAERGALG
jgi:23S rRNA pseudouridine1911/1915/1917 synthase